MKEETIKKIRDEMLDAVWDERDITVDEPVSPEELLLLKMEFYERYADVREEYPGGIFSLMKDLNRVCLVYGDEIILDAMAKRRPKIGV